MRTSTDKPKIGVLELTAFLIATLLLLLLGIARGQTPNPVIKSVSAQSQLQPAGYREYRGVRLGMTVAEVRTKLGEPALKGDDQDVYVMSDHETAQIAYNAAQRVITISTDYASGLGAPDYRSVVSGELNKRPDGSLFRMDSNQAERWWVSYNKSASMVPTVTITIGSFK